MQSKYSIIVFTGNDWSILTKYSSIKSDNLIKIGIFSRSICYDENSWNKHFTSKLEISVKEVASLEC